MNKSIYLLIISTIIFSLVTSQEICTKCSKLGEICELYQDNLQEKVSAVSKKYQCEPGLVCNQNPAKIDEMICSVAKKLGETCVDLVTNCEVGLTCNEHKCVNNVNYLTYGQSCNDTSQCYGNLECSNQGEGNVCYATTCTDQESCPGGTYCAGICTEFIAAGETCTVNQENCGPGHFCNSITLQCERLFSLQVGAGCAYNTDCDFTKGLLCLSGSCQVGNNSIISCSTQGNQECQDYQYCSCETNTCQNLLNVNSKCVDNTFAYIDCLDKAKAQPIENIKSPLSLAFTSCGKEYCLSTKSCSPGPCNSFYYPTLCDQFFPQDSSNKQ